MDFERFKNILGETIVLYQFIEYDLRIIYAGMLEGNFDENLELAFNNRKISGLGSIIRTLEKLDFSDDKPYLSKVDYKLLKDLAGDRNYFCHQCATDFMYENKQNKQENKFKSVFNKLLNAHNGLEDLHKQIERARIDILKRLNRI